MKKRSIKNRLPPSAQERLENLRQDLVAAQATQKLYERLAWDDAHRLQALEQIAVLPPTEKDFRAHVHEIVEVREAAKRAESFWANAKTRCGVIEGEISGQLINLEQEEKWHAESRRNHPEEAPRLMIVTSSQPKDHRAFEAPRKVVASGKKKNPSVREV